MWSGEALGAATKRETITVEAGRYRSIVTVAIQPGRAESLFTDPHGGTVQRTLLVDASHDPRARVIAAPSAAPLPIVLPGFGAAPPGPMGGAAAAATGGARFELAVADAVRTTIQAERIAVSSGDVKRDPLDTHMSYQRLKIAATAAIMHGREAVTAADWVWSGWLIEHSRRVRDDLIEQLDEKAAAEARTTGALRGIERVAADEAASVEREESETRRWDEQKRSLLAWITRQGRPVTEAEVRRSGGAGTLRKVRPLDLLGELCDDGALVVASVHPVDDQPLTWAAAAR